MTYKNNNQFVQTGVVVKISVRKPSMLAAGFSKLALTRLRTIHALVDRVFNILLLTLIDVKAPHECHSPNHATTQADLRLQRVS